MTSPDPYASTATVAELSAGPPRGHDPRALAILRAAAAKVGLDLERVPLEPCPVLEVTPGRFAALLRVSVGLTDDELAEVMSHARE